MRTTISIKKDIVPLIDKLSVEDSGLVLKTLCDMLKGKTPEYENTPPQVNIVCEVIKQGNEIAKKEASFKPPTLEEVEAYCKERHNNVNPKQFIEYYETANWYRGKTKIKNWKACVRTWEQRNFNKPKKENRITNMSSRDIDFDDLEKQLFGGKK